MPTLSPQAADVVAARPTEADRLAARNREANFAAISRSQPRLAEILRDASPGVAWIFGRDGYLTGFEPGERGYAGCSAPLLAARAMLKSFEAGTGVACFLNPTHAAQVRVALDQLAANQALICVVPDQRALAVALQCDDFSEAIEAGRLWFACGENWAEELSRLLEEVPGLPTPSRFVRLPYSDSSAIDGMIADAQRVFAETTSRRNDEIARLRDSSILGQDVCVIAPSTFRLWDDAGETLASVMGDDVRRFDPDAPAACSLLALAKAASTSRAIVAANLSRNDLASLLPSRLPLITWLTTPNVPAYQAAGPNDVLLVADKSWRESAVRSGWPDGRVLLAGWPLMSVGAASGNGVAIIADTCATDPPKGLEDFSSHCLLWETIRRLIVRDPFVIPPDISAWLNDQARTQGIAPETLNAELFTQRLILPAYQQAIARELLEARVPLKLHGAGWSELAEFRERAAGPITSRDDLLAAARDASVLVHLWPDTSTHPIDSLGRPVVRRNGRRIESFVRDVMSSKSQARSIPQISAELLSSVLSRLEAGGGAG